jgi:hypothetical protein
MRAGKMMAESSPDELKKLAGLQTFLQLKVAEPEKDASRLRELGFIVEQEGEALVVPLPDAESLREVLSCQGLRPLSYRIVEPTLEQAFLKLAI